MTHRFKGPDKGTATEEEEGFGKLEMRGFWEDVFRDKFLPSLSPCASVYPSQNQHSMEYLPMLNCKLSCWLPSINTFPSSAGLWVYVCVCLHTCVCLYMSFWSSVGIFYYFSSIVPDAFAKLVVLILSLQMWQSFSTPIVTLQNMTFPSFSQDSWVNILDWETRK